MPPASPAPPLPPELDRRLREMPKVELHVHLEGAMDADAVWAMAERNGTPLPAASIDEWRSFYAFRDFDHFITVYTAAARAMRTPEDWAFMAERFCAGQAAQHVVYTEAFLSASLMLQTLPPAVLVDALAAGVAAGEARHGVRVRFIPDIARHVPDTQRAVLDFVSLGHERGLFLGLGLGGPEVGFPPELFRETYAEARRRGLRVVAHAGETVGAAGVRGALEALGAERIGHGVRVLEDPALVELARARGVPFEVCPTSNYRLKVVPEGAPHPIRAMVDAGLLCTVNSDDPPMFGTTLVDEYRRLARQGFAWDELWALNANALGAAFLGDAERAAYRARFDAWRATA
ncbi:adenosine deaminase [Gemmatimonadetes bacterium T265]|nr:adenosine deaminase [Gemmatimonadetes bacterium T265]